MHCRSSSHRNRLPAACPPPALPAALRQELWLYSNQLSSVPPEIGRLTGLKRLWLDRNQLRTVPRELAQLTNLQELVSAPVLVGAGLARVREREACARSGCAQPQEAPQLVRLQELVRARLGRVGSLAAWASASLPPARAGQRR